MVVGVFGDERYRYKFCYGVVYFASYFGGDAVVGYECFLHLGVADPDCCFCGIHLVHDVAVAESFGRHEYGVIGLCNSFPSHKFQGGVGFDNEVPFC